MNAGEVLLHVLVVLVAAKLAAEIAERVGLPAVVGEIVAGVAVGPSVLGLVGSDEVLRILGELGVILLLLEVGLHLDVRELRAVGASSMAVATIGVVTPFALGWAAAAALGHGGTTAVFVGAALTATSVGITARVFSDLRALATTEARTVLGAAVADDVMGLVVLTVVVRIVTEGSVTVGSVAGIVAVAVGFLLLAGAVGLRLAPPLFTLVARLSRSPGTLVGLALAFTLAFAELADAARLAPIVGAFVAGLALSRSDQGDRIGRELAPVGSVFVPVFFLQIGIDADVAAFADPGVLGVAAALLVVAVVGKMVSAFGVRGGRVDRLTIGFGMLPRGEVGLIFVTIGLREGVLGDDLYAALLLVVLATTLLAPPALRTRMGRRAAAAVAEGAGDGRLVVADGVVELTGQPAAAAGLRTALRAAVAAEGNRPGPLLLEWLGGLRSAALPWEPAVTRELVALLERGGPRSWRLLEGSGVLDRALPEVAAALRRRRDPFDLDPPVLETVERARSALETVPVKDAAPVLLAALAMDAGRQVIARLRLDPDVEADVAFLVDEVDTLAELPALDAERATQLAAHVGSLDRLRMLCALGVDGRRVEAAERILSVAGPADERRAAAVRLAGADTVLAERLALTPAPFALAHEASELVRQARLLDPVPAGRQLRVAVTPAGPGRWCVVVAGRDRGGLLADVTGALSDVADVLEASVATWPDGGAIESFLVNGAVTPDVSRLSDPPRVRAAAPPGAADVAFDDSSPWHTRVEVRAPDRHGVLNRVAAGLAVAGCDVHAARATTVDGVAVDLFDVTDRRGRKLDAAAKDRVKTTLTTAQRTGNGSETLGSYGPDRTPLTQRRRHVCEEMQSDSPA